MIVWPETALPFLLSDRPDAMAAIGSILEEGQLLLVGAVRREGVPGSGADIRYYNSVVAINSDGEIVNATDKRHLVPFGEYLPLGGLLDSLGLQHVAESPGSFTAGTTARQITLPGGATALPLICYEIIFPGILDAGGPRPDVLVNVTNDAWYGNSPGPYQHFRQARLRAVEQGLPLIRAANNGISAVVDGYGNVSDAFGLDVVGALDIPVPVSGPDTLYAATRGAGSWIVLAFFAFLAGASAGVVRLRSN